MTNTFNHADICSAETGEVLYSIKNGQPLMMLKEAWDWVCGKQYEIVTEEISYNTYTIYVK